MANNQLLASDNFSSGSLAAGWSVIPGDTLGVVIGSGASAVVEPGALSANYGQFWSGVSWGADQISEATATIISESGNILALIVRQDPSLHTRYEVDIMNGRCQIFSVVGGTATPLGATVGGLTFAAGDVWTFAAIGSAISVYQNGKRVFVIGDASITSGSPGFLEFTNTNTTHVKVSSWRGYSAIQQDGIWQKQGIVIAPVAGDLVSPNFLGIQCHSAIIHEGNAQILSGTVYKMWFDNFVNVYYAESLDGISWTRRSAPVLANIQNSCVIKNGLTYYLYGTVGGSGTIEAFTSSDGIAWTLQNSSALTTGAGWDSANLYPFFGLIVDGGTFYGLYGACTNLATTPFSLGLATSPDGITWTKYAGNPVINGKGNSTGLVKSAGIFYTWLQGNQPQGNAGAPFFDPTESVRYQSTDLHTWSNPQHSLHNSQLCESLNANTGYSTGGYLIDVSRRAYNYVTVGVGDSVKPLVGQMELAIAPTSIQNLVMFPEDAAPQVASDSFTSGAGNLDTNWTTPTGGTKLQIVNGNLCEASVTNVECQMGFTGVAFSPNHYSEIKIATLSANGQYAMPIVRMQTASSSYYKLLVQGPTGQPIVGFAIYANISSVHTQIGPSVSFTLNVNDVIRLMVTTGPDGNPILSALQNGFLILQVEDYANTLTSGVPGIAQSTSPLSGSQISSWVGGNANVIPNYPNLTCSGFLDPLSAPLLTIQIR